MLAALLFSLQIALPNVILIALGWLLKTYNQINDNFAEQASKLVFNFSLPSLMFFSLVHTAIDYQSQAKVVLAGAIITFILYAAASVYAHYFVKASRDKGVFIQGVFRSNTAVIGLAMVVNAYGTAGLGVGAVFAGAMTFLYNILAVIVLTQPSEQDSNLSFGQKLIPIIKKIITNPLILAIVAALVFKELHIPIPDVITQTGKLLADTALPLALIGAGATFELKSMVSLSGVSLQSSIGRLVVAPLVAVPIGLMLGLKGVEMGVLYLMSASPVAAASYVMARTMGGNDIAAANILGFTTVAGILTSAIGAAILRSLGLI